VSCNRFEPVESFDQSGIFYTPHPIINGATNQTRPPLQQTVGGRLFARVRDHEQNLFSSSNEDLRHEIDRILHISSIPKGSSR
jgi:hypothetical protein